MTPLMPLGFNTPPARNPGPPELRDEVANLREILAGDEAATLRFHDRMLDLQKRFDFWRICDAVAKGRPVKFLGRWPA